MTFRDVVPMFEDWADPLDQRSRAVTEFTTIEHDGRTIQLRPGDLVTPRQAQEHRLRTRPRR